MRVSWTAPGFLLAATLWPVQFAQAQQPDLPRQVSDNSVEAKEITSSAPAAEGQPEVNASPQRPVATRQTAFAIPFSVDSTLASGLRPVEVQLLISADRGRQWAVYLRQRPEARKFNFRAAEDGEYWFASRTIDSQNRPHPQGQVEPELKVVVDTHAPKFELTVTASPNGEIKTAWNVFDPNLTPESFRLEYRPASGQVWLPVLPEPLKSNGQPGNLVGEHSFIAQTASQVIDVRGEVRDDAGNSATANKRVFLPRTARRGADRPVEGLLSGLAGLAKSPFGTSESTTAPPDPLAGRRPAPPGATATDDLNTPPTNVPYGIKAPPEGLSSPLTTPASGAPAVAAQPALPTQPWLPTETAADKPVGDVSQYPPAKSAASTAPPTRFASKSSEPAGGPSEEPVAELPPGEKPSFTAARHFNLDYETDSVGPSGVASVELWGTSDRGRTWTKWGVDTDKQSPIRVDVDSDGLYGFSVVVESGLGLAGPRPRSGDPADMWVGVDSTKPQARLTSALFGTGEAVGQLDIRWEAGDDNLTPRPVSLSFAEESAGPWTVVAAGLPNNGRYLWNADPRLPRNIFLKLEVRDEAGNVGEHVLAEPISTEGLSPKGRIRGVRPIDDNSQGAALQRVVR